ncbi:MAG: aldo/keto reductase [Gammaproteobacteria bacterium]|nr:aldo/keto reductase [Gammaproteobacteria bacterium]
MSFSEAEYRQLGSTGITLSPIGLGTVKLGRNTNVKYPKAFDLPDDDTVTKLLATAQRLGINYLDTAPAYGTSEERLGRLISDRGAWIISTKVGERYDNGTSTFDFSRAATEDSVRASLERLQTSYLDLVLVHSDGNDEAVIGQTDILDTLGQLKSAGHIRAIGVSTKTVTGGLLAIEVADVVMVAYNTEDTSQMPVIERALELEEGILVKKPLASGHADNIGESLRFALAQPAVTSVVVGTINPVHLQANIDALETSPS